jgi:predicted nucleic acid-binding protein
VKLVLHEADSQDARATVTNALKKGCKVHVVDVALAEGLSVIWKHVNVVKDLLAEEGMRATEDLMRVYDKLDIVSSREIAEEAVRIAFAQSITVFDALHVAAARELNGTLYTADKKMHNIAPKDVDVKLLKTKNTSDAKVAD